MPGAERRIMQRLRAFRVPHWVMLTVMGILVFMLSFWLAESWNKRLAIEALLRTGSVTVASYDTLLQNEIEQQRLVPFILADDPDVITALSAPASSPASSLAAVRAKLNQKFAFLRTGTTASVIYLLNAQGITVAASNWNQPDSFVGYNFAYRAYYSRARTDGTGAYFTMGEVTHQPGLFLSHSVVVNGKFLGVVVVKVTFQRLEDAWAQDGAKILVANGSGVVLITDVPGGQFRTVAPLPEAQRASLRTNERFGAMPLTPLPTTTNDGHRLFVIGGARFVAVTAQVSTTNWTIYYLDPLDVVLHIRKMQALLLAGFFTGLVLGLTFLVRIRLQHFAAMQAQMAEMQHLSVTDPLTQLLNRRAFENTVDQEWKRASRTGTRLAAIMVDVDYFKLFNDFYGHLAGDVCLQKVAGVLRDSAKRPGDAVARYGGEEFIVLLPNTDLDDAVRLAQTILHATRALNITHEKSPLTGQVTISVGVAACSASDTNSSECLISAADTALYDAKRAGRDRIACAVQIVMNDVSTSVNADERNPLQYRNA
jgi:two-component system, NtrC family, C4-dicarboxylate transport sensor histidine kinase DctB